MAEKPAESPDVSHEHSEDTPPTADSFVEFDRTDEDEEDSQFEWDFDVISNLLALFSVFFASTWMLVVPSGIIGFIVQAFPLESEKSVWVAAAVTIPLCVGQTFTGELSDHLGRRSFLLTGMALGVAGTLVAGRAHNMDMVIGGQVLSGVGLTLGYLAIPLASELVPKNQRPKIQGVIGIFAGIANCTGVIIAGAFIKHKVGGIQDGWRAGFYLASGFYFLAFIAVFFFYHPSARPNPHNLSVLARLRKIDWIGVFLVAAGLTIFLVGLEYGGNPYPWDSARVLAPLIVGGACLVAFALWQTKGTKTGLLHHSMFVDKNFAVILLLNFVGGMVLFGGQAFLPQELIYLFTSDAVLTGVYSLPFNTMGIVGGIVGGIAMTITKEAKTSIIVSFATMVVASGLMAVMEPHINYAAWFFPTSMLGLAVGCQIALLPVVASFCTPNHLIAHTISLIGCARAFGGSIGVVIFSQVFSSKVKAKLPAQVAAAVIKAGLPPTSVPLFLQGILTQNVTLLATVPGFSPAVVGAAEKAVPQAYADSFRFVWYSLIPFAAVSLGLSFWVKSTRDSMTRQVVAQVEHRHAHAHHVEEKRVA